MQNRLFVDSIIVVILVLCITGAIYVRSILNNGPVTISPIETIHAIPYPIQGQSTFVLENLAHADIFLHTPVFAKSMLLTITFNPKDTARIDAGIRSGGFWLGYNKQTIYTKGVDSSGVQTKTVVFPLTASFEDTNQSIDMMLFSESDTGAISWSVNDIHATVHAVLPTMQETKDYIKSLWNREREL
ncbi:MAG: hypothetical protein A3E36_00385 [Candidatus Andersenbacteria bacterium RIFCSPHIGHO2_12_FULL_45_11b]|uniref:Uncharacterized protein n=1 Tax=Candidatus Andersenbacteria bacterium RIFCSPHIGHO2_12_FULL_45_11b TaxID=1797282 RepID=A0A1G1XAR1_9BACT|nr:MAG: hypothetical protein A3E36_00385 [Candidatus Andersenbacteria bacterium RIFCSPHIGHO2_12_FULL_45_11b]